MAAPMRLNMGHGFMQCIIRNQVDRDKYEKDAQTKTNLKPQQNGSKDRKPSIQTYLPPSMRRQQEPGSRIHLFRFEYLDEQGEVQTLEVYKDDDPGSIARHFGQDYNFSPPMIKAMTEYLRNEMKKRLEPD